MRDVSLLFVGVLVGGAAIYGLMSICDTLDDGVSRSYRCDQLAREEDARRSAEQIIRQLLLDKSLTELEAITTAAGLHMDRFEKSEHIEVVVGRGAGTAALNFEATMEGHITALSIPGSVPCEALEGTLGHKPNGLAAEE